MIDVRTDDAGLAATHRSSARIRGHGGEGQSAGGWMLVACTLPGLVMLLPVLSTIDVGYGVRAGEIMLDTGDVLRTDPFGLATGGGPWLNQQWLSEIVFALVYRAGGWQALIVARAVLFSVIFSLVYAVCRARGAGVRPSALLTIGAFIVALGLELRAELLGMALFALTFWIVAIRHRRPAALWATLAIIAVWSNVHGSFFLGPIILGLAYLEDRSDRPQIAGRTLLVSILGLVATIVNPFGLGVWPYALGLSTSRHVTEMVMEWGPTTVRSAIGILFYASTAGVTWFLARRPGPVPRTSLLGLGLFAAGALWAIRGVAWWALAVPPILAPLLPRDVAETRGTEQGRRVNAVSATILALLAVAFLPWWRTVERPAGAVLRFAPTRLTAELRHVTGPKTRMFNPQLWGSWFELALPGRATFVDARIEIQPEYVWRDYFAISGAHAGWEMLVERWDFDVIVAEHSSQGPLVDALGDSSDWQQIYGDDQGAIFVRRL